MPHSCSANQQGPQLTPGDEGLSSPQDWGPHKLQSHSINEKQEVIEETGEHYAAKH